MLKYEGDPDVLRTILVAVGHYLRPEVIVAALRFRRHEDSRVRDGVLFALMWSEDPRAIAAIVELTRDEDSDIRDWATFSLGNREEPDTPEIREALAARLYDSDADTRGEAMLGLVRRGDPRVLPALLESLDADSISIWAVEAAYLIGEPDLHPQLVALRGWWDADKNLLEEAIQACAARPT
jgi:HEAT repeat protein